MDTTRSRVTEVVGAISMVLGLIVALLAITVAPAYGDGAGSSQACWDMANSANGGTATAPEGKVITEICFKAGQLHSGVITADGDQVGTYEKNQNETDAPYSYTVSGIGTNSVTVTQNEGPGLSHVDFVYDDPEEPGTAEVCDTTSGEIIEVDEQDANNEGYAPVDDPACEEEEPETVEVCDTTSGEIIEVDEQDANNEGYAPVDDPACEEEEPEEDPVAYACTDDGVIELVGDDAIAQATEDGLVVRDTEDDADIDCAQEEATAFACVDDEVVELEGDAEIAAAAAAGTIHDTRGAAEAECSEVLGVVEERDPDPEPAPEPEEEAELPATEVKGEQVAAGGQLPNTGAEHMLLGLFAGGFLMLGGAMLLLGDRRRRVLA